VPVGKVGSATFFVSGSPFVGGSPELLPHPTTVPAIAAASRIASAAAPTVILVVMRSTKPWRRCDRCEAGAFPASSPTAAT
jgi:hypothetical protein